MKGFYNRMLMIDLTSQSFETRNLHDSLFETYLGGKGLASHLLLQHNPARVEPFAAENCLIFATGPATGSAIWGSCRYGVYTKSPQTGFYADFSLTVGREVGPQTRHSVESFFENFQNVVPQMLTRTIDI